MWLRDALRAYRCLFGGGRCVSIFSSCAGGFDRSRRVRLLASRLTLLGPHITDPGVGVGVEENIIDFSVHLIRALNGPA